MPQDKQFVHLHVHSDYSRLDGMSKVQNLVSLAAEYGMPGVALSDHGTMGGLASLFMECDKLQKKTGQVVKPIPAYEAYQTDDRFARGNVGRGKANYHLMMIAYSDQGYHNLLKISSRANLESKYGGRPRVDTKLLAEYSDGLIATTGCLGSMVNQELLHGDRDKAVERAQEMIDIFGRENYYVEVQNHHFEAQESILEDQKWLAQKLDLPLLATNDSHYDHKCDAHTHEALLCAQTGTTIDDPERFKFESDENYFRTAEEMYDIFPEDEWPGACENTVKIAERVNIKNPVNNDHLLPQFPIPDDYSSSREYLAEQTRNGLVELYGDQDGNLPDDVLEQEKHELGIIDQMGFNDYFLILGESIKWARSKKIGIGPGRGSGAGAIVSYANRITNVDPLMHGLYFERFLNPGRSEMPDIDIDVAKHQREEFLQHAIDMYGIDRVAHIATYGAYQLRKAIETATRVLGYPASTSRKIKSMLPGGEYPLSILLADNKDDVPKDCVRAWRESQDLRDSASEYGEIYLLAENLNGVISNIGMHAGGILITPGPVSDYFPVKEAGDDGIPVCEFDKKGVESFGGLKIDYLGLTNLSIIDYAVRLIEKDLGKKVDIDNLPHDDAEVFKMIASGENDGVFQLNQHKIQDWIRSMKPDRFDDLSAMSALNRPGPMESNIHVEYADRKNGRKPIEVIHPDMADILKDTYGLVVYQEQVMQLSQHYAGYNAAEADNFRKAMGKKEPAAMAAQHDKFFDGCKENGYSEELAQQLWDIIEPFSGYAFNKSHSVAYGYISYQTAWLKCHYPAQYAAAILAYSPDDKVSNQVDSCRRQGIKLYSPDINESDFGATTSADSIWIGMSSVKSCGSIAISDILDERNANGKFKSLPDFLTRLAGSKVNKTVVKNLINVGAFDNLHPSRRAMTDNVEDMMNDARKVASSAPSDDEDDLFNLSETVSVKSSLDYYDLTGPDYNEQEKSSNEVGLLGFFVGTHPFNKMKDSIERARRDGLIENDVVEPVYDDIEPESKVKFIGIMTNYSRRKTKSGKYKIDFVLESSYSNRVDVISFDPSVTAAMQGKLVIVEGNAQVDSFSEDNKMIVMANDVEELDIMVIPGQARKKRRRRDMRNAPQESNEEDTQFDPDDVPMVFDESFSKTDSAEPVKDEQPSETESDEDDPSQDDEAYMHIERDDEPVSPGRPKLRVIEGGMSKKYNQKREQRSRDAVQDDEPLRFMMKTRFSDMKRISDMLNQRGKGTTTIVFDIDGEVVDDPRLTFNITEDDISQLCSQFDGSEYRRIQ